MFKSFFKKYKSRTSPAGLEDVINPDINTEGVEIGFSQTADVPECVYENLGLIPPKEWNIYYVKSQPGLIIVKNPFTWAGQRYWIKKCLVEYPNYPNKNNLDANGLKIENWWELCQRDLQKKQVLFKKLRWVTLGYHHNWDTKKYSEDSKSPMPQELIQLCRICAYTVGGWNTTAQAAIVNFYPFGSTLSGHVDYSEPNDEEPIVSLSFGAKAIFLIGGIEGTQENTSAVLLESGDILVMSEKSRRAIHGIPKIMAPLSPYPWNALDKKCFARNDDWNSTFEEYVTSARININLRQVLRNGQTSLM